MPQTGKTQLQMCHFIRSISRVSGNIRIYPRCLCSIFKSYVMWTQEGPGNFGWAYCISDSFFTEPIIFLADTAWPRPLFLASDLTGKDVRGSSCYNYATWPVTCVDFALHQKQTLTQVYLPPPIAVQGGGHVITGSHLEHLRMELAY